MNWGLEPNTKHEVSSGRLPPSVPEIPHRRIVSSSTASESMLGRSGDRKLVLESPRRATRDVSPITT